MKVLLIANRTLASRKVFERIVWLRDESATVEVHIVVPVTPSDDSPSVDHDLYGRPVVDYLAIDAATARLGAAVSTIAELGVEVTGELGSPDPLTALRTALRRDEYGRVVLSTLPAGTSRWLRMDLVHRAQRLAGSIPVDHVIGDEESTAAATEPMTWDGLGITGLKDELDVLIVDDNEADLELTTIALERAPIQCRIRTVSDGEKALAMANDQPPDLILLDLSMPGVSGFDALGLLKADDALESIPVVILTTSDRAEDRQRAHDLGAAAYVVKEHDFARFEAVLLGLLAETATE